MTTIAMSILTVLWAGNHYSCHSFARKRNWDFVQISRALEKMIFGAWICAFIFWAMGL